MPRKGVRKVKEENPIAAMASCDIINLLWGSILVLLERAGEDADVRAQLDMAGDYIQQQREKP